MTISSQRIEVKFPIYVLFQFSISNNQVLGIANVSTFNRIAHKLGIPEPPKRPAIGYVRFQQENRDSLQQKVKSQNDFFSLVGAQWKQLSQDQKEKYNNEFEKEFVSEIHLK